MSAILVTGASGYVGQELAARLLRETEHELVLWLHASSIEEAEKKAAPLRQRFAANDVRLRFAHGELAAEAPFAGVEPQSVRAIVHSAAVTRFNVDEDTARTVNIEGSEKVFAFARQCRGLERLVQVSTVYASGTTEGRVDEHAPFAAPGFANHYERSKHAAEEILTQRYSDLPACIARVATVIADDDSGRVTQQNAVHNTLKLFFHGLLSLVPGKTGTPLYFVTGDYAAEALAKVTAHGKTGRVYHVAHPRGRSIDLQTFVDEAFAVFGEDKNFKNRRIMKPLFADAESFDVLVSSIDGFGGDVLRQALASVAPFARQLFIDKDVRTDNLEALLPTAGPDARELARATCAWLVKTRWGKAL
jgi:nucleoside-diphosphate-sugar epimerase